MNGSTSEQNRTHVAYLEVTADDTWTGHLLEFPGCVAFGTSEIAVSEALADDLRLYRDWLVSHGEAIDAPIEPSNITVAEVIREVSPARKSGEAVALFTPDLESVTSEVIDRTLALLRYCQADIEHMLRKQPAEVRDFRLAQGNRSVVEIVRHIGQAECWYLTRLEPGDLPEIADLYQRVTTGDPVDGLRAVLNAATSRFGNWSAEQRVKRFVPQHNSRYGTEAWTARKVLRRFVEHRREHLDELQRTISAAHGAVLRRGHE